MVTAAIAATRATTVVPAIAMCKVTAAGLAIQKGTRKQLATVGKTLIMWLV
jgi:hypothetical protein